MYPEDQEPQQLGHHVMITSREIYDAVQNLIGKVEAVLSRQENTGKTLQDHETRIRSLEANRWPIPTIAVIVAIAGVVIALIKN